MNKSPMRRAREKAGLTLAAVSAGTGIPFSTVQAFEQGLGAGFSVERKAKLAAFLGEPFFSLWPEEKQKARSYAAIDAKRTGKAKENK